MSIYGYLNCHDCRQSIWLGKAMRKHGRVCSFHRGSENDPPHWRREQLNQAMWKFLADHASHAIDVRLEHQMTEEVFAYQEIGGDSETGISFADYIAGWHGLDVGGEERNG
jgi:hypothetical protein